ncbi:phosphatase PAP2 family protein [Shewanella sp.]|uniref:phosphatase PAP2 family protein n=1 Tax=Shewanella sp. TaxID=50422 RepID=UPI00356798E0
MHYAHASRFGQGSRPLLLLLFWLVLLLPSTMLYLLDIKLFPLLELDSVGADFLYWVTFTGTAPWGALTAAAVAALGFYRLSRAQATRMLLALALSLGGGLVLNEHLKTCFDEPRPNAEYLAKKNLLQLDVFYGQSKQERRTEIAHLLTLQDAELPLMTQNIAAHWRQEVGLSFPSGHTLYAATLSLTVCWFFIASGHRVPCLMLGGWAVAMGFSRMFLGMHHSQDVLAATALSLPLVSVGIIGAQLLTVLVQRRYSINSA